MAATRTPKCRASAGKTATVTINVAAVTPTPAPASVAEATSTPIPNVWDAPSISGWGLVALVAGMLVMTTILLRRTSGGGPQATDPPLGRSPRLHCPQRQGHAGEMEPNG